MWQLIIKRDLGNEEINYFNKYDVGTTKIYLIIVVCVFAYPPEKWDFLLCNNKIDINLAPKTLNPN